MTRGARAAAIALTFGACASPDRSSYQLAEGGDPLPRWRDALAALDLDVAWLDDTRVAFVDTTEPGILPDGTLQVPEAWRLTPTDPQVLGRLAHLGRHHTLGLVPDTKVPCLIWELHMLASELDGLALELYVRDALRAPLAPAEAAAMLAQREIDYHRRCAARE